ncbi:hypothetical protein Clacol_009697 [Clathrus columnatus]|uniref:Uncharacterized protein n=1 Tax=Clathrus columnatus TaxID=1419009 RepID=A0AAV5ALU2_9AGAM|nr:hypothetical protein Clacol_009697 [Clathrus columnatus]
MSIPVELQDVQKEIILAVLTATYGAYNLSVALNGHLRWLNYTLTALFVGEIIGALVLFIGFLHQLEPQSWQAYWSFLFKLFSLW